MPTGVNVAGSAIVVLLAVVLQVIACSFLAYREAMSNPMTALLQAVSGPGSGR